MASLLKQGFNTVATAFVPGGSTTVKAIGYATSGFFPAEQREKVVSSNVSNTPYTSFFGYRPVTPEVQTLRSPFVNWWQQKIYEPAKKWYMGYKTADLGRQAANTLAQTAQIGIAKVGASLTDYFIGKWGLSTRAKEAGDQYSYYNEGQSNAPATTPAAGGFFDAITQPLGSFFIGNPQSAPIPAGSITGVPDYPSSAGVVVVPTATTGAGGTNLMPILLIAGVGLAIFLFMRKT